MSRLRRRAAHAVLSALAGGGLTAVGLGAALPSSALGVGAPAGTQASSGGAAEALAASDAGAEAQQTGVGGRSTSTSTAPSPSSASTTSSPSSVAAGPTSSAPQAGAPASGGASIVPVVKLQRRQRTTAASGRGRKPTRGRPKPTRGRPKHAHGKPKHARRRIRGPRSSRRAATAGHDMAPPPQLAADRLHALAAELTFSGASAQSLAFYRIPLFLLPIYRAAAVRYDVPWQILAAINEVETDYGNDLSVSAAGAVGWMQFMPATWTLYGVDAVGAGYADPYNPVDAIFAAARYLRDMGAANNQRAAIFAYNHSAAYVESVLLRAELISIYPKPVIATLAGLAEGRVPMTGGHVAWEVLRPRTSSSRSSATANAKAVAPATAAAAATGLKTGRLADVRGARSAAVVAVQRGHIVGLGRSRKLGSYVVLRDLHGDVFTYAGLGGIAASYTVARTSHGSIGARELRLPLRRGSFVEQGTVLGRVREPIGARDGHLLFAIRPAGDRRDVDPRAILASWALLAAALHPPGASGQTDPLDGAAASRGGFTATVGAARPARSGRRTPAPIVVREAISAGLWDELIARIGALPAPAVAVEQSSGPLRDDR